MWRRCVYLFGVALIAFALAAVPSPMIVGSYVGGSAVHGGYVEDGRFFVNPGHGSPAAEVSESTWRFLYRVERAWPLSALVPGLVGLFLTAPRMGPDWRPPPPPPAELPPWFLWACLASAWITLAGGGLCYAAFRAPWAAMLVGYVLFCASCGTVVWLYCRDLRQQPPAEPPAAPDPPAPR